MSDQLDYKQFVTQDEARTYKRVKWVTMHLSRIAREVIADLTGGRISDPGGSRKQFVETSRGLYRISMGPRSDNSTEVAVHLRMGVESINFADEKERRRFWAKHRLNPELTEIQFTERLRRRLA